MANQMPSAVLVAPPNSLPQSCWSWNGELRLRDRLGPPPTSRSSIEVYTGFRARTEVLIKRVPAGAIDPANVDFNMELSAWVENEQRLHSGGVHLLKTLTCHTGRPEDESTHVYIALESCDFNLVRAVELSRIFMAKLPSLTTLAHYDEDAAPLVLWRARRSAARQLVAAVAYLHDLQFSSVGVVYHNSLKPTNVLFKNGVVKVSEIPCYRKSEPLVSASLLSQAPAEEGGV